MWQVHYHYEMRMQKQQLSVYTFKKNGNGVFFIAAIPEKEKGLVNQIQLALDGFADYPTNHYSKMLDNIFYGPWIVDELTKQKYCRITEAEHRRLSAALYRESAERIMAEAALNGLQKEFDALQKYCDAQSAQLLRVQALTKFDLTQHEIEPQPDLLKPEFDPNQLEFRQFMAHHSQVLCSTGGCGEI